MFYLLLCWSLAFAIEVTEVPDPAEMGLWVVDVADIIDVDTEAKINAYIEQLHRDSDVEIALVTVNTVTSTPKGFATALFNHWGIGDKEKNNGLLILMVMGQRRLEMETGYGLEKYLPDSWLGVMQVQTMVPLFKKAQFAQGLEQGILSVDNRLREQLGLEPAIVSAELIEKMTVGVKETQFMVVEQVSSIPEKTTTPVRQNLPKTRTTSKPDYMASGDAEMFLMVGGGLVVIVGIFGLRAYIRKRQRTCPTCNILMTMLSEKEDDAYLSSGQRTEEKIGSVDHQYYTCSQCGFSKLISDGIWFSGYGKCPKCSYKTLSSSRTTITSPTYSSGGLDQVTENCSHCFYNRTYTVSTPKLTPPSQSSSSSSSSYGGGSSSSGGSSSGGGWGGGSSGGGGAGSSW